MDRCQYMNSWSHKSASAFATRKIFSTHVYTMAKTFFISISYTPTKLSLMTTFYTKAVFIIKKKEKKKPVIRRLESAEATNLPPVCTEIGFPGPILQDSSLINDDGGELGMTDALGLAPPKATTAISSRKRERQGHYTPSPKKLKTILGGKVHVLHAESESDLDSTLVSLKQKKKVGRPLGSLNKVPKPAKDLITPPLHISTPKFGRGEASPYNKGKEVA